MGGAILTSYIGAVCGNRIFRNYGMNGGYFRASKLRQALSSLNLQNPERSSSLEAPRAFTRHWSSRRSCPRATTRGQATTISEIILPSIYSDQDHHQRIDRPPIYRSTVEKTPTEKTRASTRYRRNRRRCSRAPAPPHGLKPRTRASRLQNSRKAAISDSFRPIYHLVVEPPPLEVARASTRRWELRHLRSRATGACELNNGIFQALF
uniref:Uncharacterized protein n=1 Tax=Fagus sylvatica TaxID=28930 RepID=A0A2N9I5I5_FAGSY